jgi:hypothetical protein
VIKFGFVFLLLLAGSAFGSLARGGGGGGGDPRADPGPAQNERLTALAGLLVYVLLVAIAVTIVNIGQFLGAHFLVGFLLIPPLILKFGSTGYRLVRYYSGSKPYREIGPPPAFLRFIVAPALVGSTLVVFASGLELWLFGLRFGSVWITAHTVSAVVMMAAVAAHSAAHVSRSAAAVRQEIAGRRDAAVSPQSLVVASVATGAVLAIASLLYASPFSASVGGG